MIIKPQAKAVKLLLLSSLTTAALGARVYFFAY